MNDSEPENSEASPEIELPPVGQPDKPVSPVPYGWLRAVLFLIAYVVVSIVTAVVTVIILGASRAEDIHNSLATSPGMITTFLTLVATLAVIWLFRALLDRRSMASLGYSFGPAERRDLLSGILWGVGLIGGIFLILLAAGQIALGAITFPVESFLIQLALGVMVAITEESVTRGYLLNNLMQSAHKYLALLLVSVLFAAFHAFNPNVSIVGAINIVLAGLLLGIYYVHRRNLWFPIGLHFAWNLFQGGVFGSAVSGLKFQSIINFDPVGPVLLTGGDFGFEASLVTTVAMSVGIIVIHLKYRERQADPDASVEARVNREGTAPDTTV